MANYSLGVFYQGTVYTILVQQNSTGEWGFIQNGLNQIGWKSLQLIPGTPIYDNSAIGSSFLFRPIHWYSENIIQLGVFGAIYKVRHNLGEGQRGLRRCDSLR